MGIKYDFVSGCGSASQSKLTDVLEKIKAKYMLLMYSAGMVKCVAAGEIEDIEHLLEARLFSESAELKIMRPTIGCDFSWRIIDDNEFRKFCDNSAFDKTFENCTLDEKHYLDINSDLTDKNSSVYTATGGGRYVLPESGLEKVLIRDYIFFDDNGIANIADFRIVKFLKAGEKCE